MIKFYFAVSHCYNIRFICSSPLIFIDKPPKKFRLKYSQDANLVCKSSNRRIKILQVQYRDEKATDTCITPNAFCSVAQLCTGKQSCSLYADSSFIPSPCKDLKPNLDVAYECERILPGNCCIPFFHILSILVSFGFTIFIFYSYFSY